MLKKLTTAWTALMAVTAVNVLVSSGYTIAGMLAPQSILPATATPGDASFIFSLYTAARTLPLAVMVLYTIFTQRKSSIMTLAVLAGFIQFADGFIGIYEHDVMKTAGPFLLCNLQPSFGQGKRIIKRSESRQPKL